MSAPCSAISFSAMAKGRIAIAVHKVIRSFMTPP
jgi:hypothetical protein